MASSFHETVPDGWSVGFDELRAGIESALRTIVFLAVTGTWLAFWGLVMRLHVTTGSYLSAGVVGGLFILPALGVLGYTLLEHLPVDSPDWSALARVLPS